MNYFEKRFQLKFGSQKKSEEDSGVNSEIEKKEEEKKDPTE